MDVLDESIDHHLSPLLRVVRRNFTVFSASILVLLIGVSFIKLLSERPLFMATLVSKDIKKIVTKLEIIDEQCVATSLGSGRTPLNFFTVKNFTGSVIGGIELQNPVGWRGPYLEVNPSLQQQYYELVETGDGFYVIPGRGVILPNGYVVGKDFDVMKDTDVAKMLQPGGFLHYKNEQLAMRVKFKKLVSNVALQFTNKKAEQMNTLMQEFSQAMPFAQASQRDGALQG